MNSNNIKRNLFRSRGQTLPLGIIGALLLLSFTALPCDAQETNDSTSDDNAYQLIQLLNQNETLNSEIASLRGQIEELIQAAERSRESQKKIAADFDRRLVQIESKPSLDTSEGKAKIEALERRMVQIEEALAAMHQVISSAERTLVETSPADQAYETALENYRNGDYESAIPGFQAFLDNFGSDAAAPNARYWLAEALLRQNDYGSAIQTGEALIAMYPESEKVPDTIFLLGKAYLEMGDSLSARDTWETLVVDYADTDAAAKARDLLARLP